MRRRDTTAKAKERQPLDTTDPTLQRFLDRASVSDLEAVTPSFAPQFKDGFTGSSNNYEEGSSGWHISENGDAEFNNVTVRGTVDSSTVIGGTIKTAASGKRVEINSATVGVVRFYSGDGDETNYGQLAVGADVYGTAGELQLITPTFGGQDTAYLLLRGESADGTSRPSTAVLVAVEQYLNGLKLLAATAQVNAGTNLKKENFGAYVHHDTATKKMVEDGTDAFTWPGGVAFLGRTVTFPTAFSAAPRVYCQYRDAGSTDCIVIVRALSATQFTYSVVQKDNVNIGAGVQAEVMWFATGNPTGT